MKEYDFAWLYASDKVIRAINNFFDSISPDTNINSNTSMSLLFTIIIEMRKDLSIKSKLNVSDWKPRNPYK